VIAKTLGESLAVINSVRFILWLRDGIWCRSQFRGGAEVIKRTLGCAALCGWLMAGGLLQAHHSIAGVYDMKKEAEMSGSVEKIQFSNPHGSLTLSVKNQDGTTTEWVMTLGSATALAQRGIGKTGPNALHTGDNITVKYLPARNGSPLGFLKSVTMPDGRVIQISAGNPND
jgi:hypothetical protein